MSKRIRNKKNTLSIAKLPKFVEKKAADLIEGRCFMEKNENRSRYGDSDYILCVNGTDGYGYFILPERKRVVWASRFQKNWNNGLADTLTRRIFG